MSQVTQRKSRTPHAVQFDGLEQLTFPTITLAASQSNATVQAVMLLPTTYKILRIMAVATGALAGGCAINLVAGAAAEGTVGMPDTRDNGAAAFPIPIAPAGTIVLPSDTAVTLTANAVSQIDVPAPLFDVVYKGLLTLRTATNGAAAGSLTVAVLAKPTDINPPQGAYGSISIGSYTGQGAFTPATAIP